MAIIGALSVGIGAVLVEHLRDRRCVPVEQRGEARSDTPAHAEA